MHCDRSVKAYTRPITPLAKGSQPSQFRLRLGLGAGDRAGCLIRRPVAPLTLPTVLACGDQQDGYVIPQMTVRVLFQAIHELCAELAYGLVPFCHEEILYSF